MSGSGKKWDEGPPPPYKRTETSSTESFLSTTPYLSTRPSLSRASPLSITPALSTPTSQGSGRRIYESVHSGRPGTKKKSGRGIGDSALAKDFGRHKHDSVVTIRPQNLPVGESSSDKHSPTKQPEDRPFAKLELEDVKHLPLDDKVNMIITVASMNVNTDQTNIGVTVLRVARRGPPRFVAHAVGPSRAKTRSSTTSAYNGSSDAIFTGEEGESFERAVDALVVEASKDMAERWRGRYRWT